VILDGGIEQAADQEWLEVHVPIDALGIGLKPRMLGRRSAPSLILQI
jgi:hypothetical protein